MEIENKILDLFLFNNKLKFNEIEKQSNIRSNHLTYHLKSLIKRGILEKDSEYYKLSETSEYLIPYISNKKSILPVILIHIGDQRQVFLCKRTKRPYKDLLSLPGGRIIIGESIKQSTERIIKEKFNVKVKYKKVNSISLEHVKKKNMIIHSFLLIFVDATTKDKIQLTNINQNKSRIISSDYKLLTKDLNKNLEIQTIFSKTN